MGNSRGKEEGDKKHKGGTPVQIGASGVVKKGPAGLKGKDLDQPGKPPPSFADKQKDVVARATEKTSAASRPQLTEDEQSALEHYTASAWINDELRGLPLRPETKYFTEDRMNEVRRDLASSFKKVKPMEAPVLAYRGAGVDTPEDKALFLKRMMEAAKSGEEITAPGYMSTSKDESAAKEYMGEHGVFVRIEVTRGLDLTHYGAGDSRGEMLLDHNSRFKIKSVSKDESGKPVVVMTQVG